MAHQKQYGLIVPDKSKKSGAGQSGGSKGSKSKNVFGDDSSDEGESNVDWVKQSLKEKSHGSMQQKASMQVMKKALEDDPSCYDYDEVYEEMVKQKEENVEKKKGDRKPKYIHNLLRTAKQRELENELRDERKAQKEREEEGDMFADKEAFVTSGFKKKMEEVRQMQAEQAYNDAIDDITDVTKQKDMSGFYRHLFKETVKDMPQQPPPPAPKNKSTEGNTESSVKDERDRSPIVKRERDRSESPVKSRHRASSRSPFSDRRNHKIREQNESRDYRPHHHHHQESFSSRQYKRERSRSRSPPPRGNDRRSSRHYHRDRDSSPPSSNRRDYRDRDLKERKRSREQYHSDRKPRRSRSRSKGRRERDHERRRRSPSNERQGRDRQIKEEKDRAAIRAPSAKSGPQAEENVKRGERIRKPSEASSEPDAKIKIVHQKENWYDFEVEIERDVKTDFYAKRTVGQVFDDALSRYLNRKGLSQVTTYK